MRTLFRPLLATAAAVAALAAIPTAARAHFIWAFVENGQARFALLDSAAAKPDAMFEGYVAKLTPRWGAKTLSLGAAKDGVRAAPVPAGDGVVLAESVVGAREREGESYLLVYHAKGAASLGAAGAAAKAPAELTARRDGADLVVKFLKDGAPVPDAEAWVLWPGAGATEVTLRTDAKGEARTPWTTGATPASGFVGVRAMVREAKAGEEGGKKYATVRRWATLTFPLSPQTAAVRTVAATTPGEKPFRRVLRESFANNHEVVSGAAFNVTLFEGKLTREQLEVHLQQRALVHNEVHRILTGADKALDVPYGDAQKNVLVFLFQDLIAMGSGWPTEAQARPHTRDFLKEIRDSEKRGPFFALGVQHVYFGGITNGGRTIGEEIGKTLKITPAYYAKSDGYPEYLDRVDRIADPKAREEMIRGGRAAYKYIIASSNEDVFKAR